MRRFVWSFAGVLAVMFLTGGSRDVVGAGTQGGQATLAAPSVVRETERVASSWIGSPRWREIAKERARLTALLASGTLDEAARRHTLRERAFLNATDGRPGLARTDAQALLALDPNDRDAHLILGLASLGNRYGVPSLTRAIELRPDATAYRARAWSHMIAGQHAEAAADFDRVIGLDATDLDAYRGRGWAHLTLGRYDMAAADFTHAMGLLANRPEAVSARGVARYLSGQLEEARQDFQAAISFRPVANAARAYNQLALDDHRRYRRVLAQLKARTTARPDDLEGWLAVAVVSRHGRISGEIEAALTRAAALAPRDVEVLMMAATYYSMPVSPTFNESRAMSGFTDVIGLKPDHAEAYFRRAVLLARRETSLPSAISDCEKALALQPGDPALTNLLAKFRTDLMRSERAKEIAAARKAAQERDAAAAAALFLAGLASAAAIPDTRTSAERFEDFHNRFMDDWAADIVLNRR